MKVYIMLSLLISGVFWSCTNKDVEQNKQVVKKEINNYPPMRVYVDGNDIISINDKPTELKGLDEK